MNSSAIAKGLYDMMSGLRRWVLKFGRFTILAKAFNRRRNSSATSEVSWAVGWACQSGPPSASLKKPIGKLLK
ncbi:hypothetical protein NPIL_636761 [Nephila pilipes]|uniref:Uncharacterized protein n=1 Tax=Nephila pilipes TaxID=299642 RepID=A0A8X6Q040_NEPPI|nr:hypothetical protein NPIL_636761 [Nephila pilipes]